MLSLILLLQSSFHSFFVADGGARKGGQSPLNMSNLRQPYGCSCCRFEQRAGASWARRETPQLPPQACVAAGWNGQKGDKEVNAQSSSFGNLTFLVEIRPQFDRYQFDKFLGGGSGRRPLQVSNTNPIKWDKEFWL